MYWWQPLGALVDVLTTNHNQLSLNKVTYLVIDEGDKMMSMGFLEQLEAVSRRVRPDRQTMLFSATFPGRLREAASKWTTKAVLLRCNAIEMRDFSHEGRKAVAEEATEKAVTETGNSAYDDSRGQADIEGFAKWEPSGLRLYR